MLIRSVLLVFAGVAFSLASCNSQNSKSAKSLKTETDTIGYAWGINIASYLKGQGYESINKEALNAAFDDVFAGKELAITEENANKLLQNYGMKMIQKKAEVNKKKSLEFLEKNKSRKEVTTLPSGMQYEILKDASGPKPKTGEKINVHYHGTLVDGTVFDSSVDRGQPFSFEVGMGRVIKGWDEALLLMPVGSKWKLYIPSDLAYGDNPRPNGPIGPGMALIFEVEVLSIDNQTEKK
jgi:FKBP-type peptidyl-prolyl cis-trans isomerase FklB